MVTATKQKSSAHAADVLSVSQTALIGNSFLKCKQMSSASTLLTLFSHSQTDVVKEAQHPHLVVALTAFSGVMPVESRTLLFSAHQKFTTGLILT